MLKAAPTAVAIGPADIAVEPYDFEALLPLELIREHTKTDDVPSVSDALLVLYRQSALEAAQEYTGLLFAERQVMTEDVRPPEYRPNRGHARTFNYTLGHATCDGRVWFYGKKNQAPQLLQAVPGTKSVELPVDHMDFGMGCCNPCGGEALAGVMYVAGFADITRTPAALRLGALKYIAHAVMNAGDNVIQHTVSGSTSSSGSTLQDASNPALASGAIEIWRSMVRDAV